MIRLHITTGDGIGWAIDEDARLMRQALSGLAEFVPIEQSQAVLATWYIRLTGGPGQKPVPPESLAGKQILCWSPNRPLFDATSADFSRARGIVGRWIVGSSQGRHEMAAMGLPATRIPYLVDNSTFRPLGKSDGSLQELRKQLHIPDGHYVIGNFFRDTEGDGTGRPKLQKGPDVFLEIIRQLRERGVLVHVLLAGPRRSWLRAALRQLNVSYSFAGRETEAGEDDLSCNTLSRQRLNELYNLLDLYLVPSRWEGGPHATLEATAAGVPVLSRPVGIAQDILEPEAMFDHPHEAADRIKNDLDKGTLRACLPQHQLRLAANHLPTAVAPLWSQLLRELPTIAVHPPVQCLSVRQPSFAGRIGKAIKHRLKRLLPSISLWHEFIKPPYGGGNQFMMALRKELARRGVKVVANNPRADVHIINSVHFDVSAFRRQLGRRGRARVIHRIDGPIHLYRGTSRELDDLCFELNEEFAYATVIQSSWTFSRIIELGYQPVRPIIVRNAVDSDIFNPVGRAAFDPSRKVRLISTSWSGNVRKGGQIYKWLDSHLDWNRFEYTFLGNLSEPLDNIRRLPPAPSEEVARQLRAHDIYLTASRNDPCSNALIEALSCGLPALYLNSGGHPELVELGGLGFDEETEILALLDHLVVNYQSFQNLIRVPTLSEVADVYLRVAVEAAGG
jgi:glycosyltransferase involved in cell wall biosynthesis